MVPISTDTKHIANLAKLPQELLVHILTEAFPAYERYGLFEAKEEPLELRAPDSIEGRRGIELFRENQKRFDVLMADKAMPANIRDASLRVHARVLEAEGVKGMEKQRKLLQGEPHLARAVQTILLKESQQDKGGTRRQIQGLGKDANDTLHSDPVQAVYFEVYKGLHRMVREYDPQPAWLCDWGVALTRLLQVTDGVKKLDVCLSSAGLLPAVTLLSPSGDIGKSSHILLPRLTSLHLDSLNMLTGQGGILDTGGMMLRSCPNLETLMLSNYDLVIPPPKMAKETPLHEKGICPVRFSLASSEPVKLMKLKTLIINRNNYLTNESLKHLMAVVGPNLRELRVFVPEEYIYHDNRWWTAVGALQYSAKFCDKLFDRDRVPKSMRKYWTVGTGSSQGYIMSRDRIESIYATTLEAPTQTRFVASAAVTREHNEAIARDCRPSILDYRDSFPKPAHPEREDWGAGELLNEDNLCYTPHEILTQALPWASSLRTLCLDIDVYSESIRRCREYVAHKDFCEPSPAPCTDLLTNFTSLEHLDINIILFRGLFYDNSEDAPQKAQDIKTVLPKHFDQRISREATAKEETRIHAQFVWGKGQEFDRARDFTAFTEDHWVEEEDKVRRFVLRPDKEGEENKTYCANDYVSDTYVRVLPQSLVTLTLRSPNGDSWLSDEASRPAVLGLLRALHCGQFPYLTDIIIDPEDSRVSSVSQYVGSGDNDRRKITVTAPYAKCFVDETVAPGWHTG
ncbi:hypothetical protein SBRCBS47491_003467 [Sporothrix bragantina]|uniref:Leucine rich repeat domain containing protein n=1 Tax=Sporothrix bragantina TaxID=671064 RepID=A0ABP0BFM4_9PEZI